MHAADSLALHQAESLYIPSSPQYDLLTSVLLNAWYCKDAMHAS